MARLGITVLISAVAAAVAVVYRHLSWETHLARFCGASVLQGVYIKKLQRCFRDRTPVSFELDGIDAHGTAAAVAAGILRNIWEKVLL